MWKVNGRESYSRSIPADPHISAAAPMSIVGKPSPLFTSLADMLPSRAQKDSDNTDDE